MQIDCACTTNIVDDKYAALVGRICIDMFWSGLIYSLKITENRIN